jgi:hypothetical protein
MPISQQLDVLFLGRHVLQPVNNRLRLIVGRIVILGDGVDGEGGRDVRLDLKVRGEGVSTWRGVLLTA